MVELKEKVAATELKCLDCVYAQEYAVINPGRLAMPSRVNVCTNTEVKKCDPDCREYLSRLS